MESPEDDGAAEPVDEEDTGDTIVDATQVAMPAEAEIAEQDAAAASDADAPEAADHEKDES